MIYLDNSAIAAAFIDDEPKGEQARTLLEQIERGKLSACTSLLTVDEFLWVIKKKLGKQIASEAAKNLLHMTHLTFISVDKPIINLAIEIFMHQGLDPRDAIHYATMKLNNLTTIVTEDEDFKEIKELTVKKLKDL